MKWIAVKKQLPANEVNVLVLTDGDDDELGRGVTIARHTEKGWYRPWKLIKVTHWMPLPEPPISKQQSNG